MNKYQLYLFTGGCGHFISWSRAHSYMHTWFLSLLVPCPLHPQSQEGEESILHTFASATFSVGNLGAARSLLLVFMIKGRERRGKMLPHFYFPLPLCSRTLSLGGLCLRLSCAFAFPRPVPSLSLQSVPYASNLLQPYLQPLPKAPSDTPVPCQGMQQAPWPWGGPFPAF